MSKKRIVVIFLIVTTLIIASFFVMQKKSKEVVVEQKQDTPQQPIDNDQQSQQIQANQLVWYDVPELGIRFMVEVDMKDELVYNYRGEQAVTNLNGKTAGKVKSVGFSTKKLAALDKYCSSDRGPVGILSKFEGRINQYDALKIFKGVNKWQFNNFVIAYEGSQSSCSINYKGDPNQKIEDPIRIRYSEYFNSEKFIQSIEIIK